MRHINDQQYSQFTPKERLNLTIAALSRGDESEADRLWQTCPRYRYDTHDFQYTLSVDALMILSGVFFEKCVLHYNRIKKAEIFIMSSEYDLEFEEKEGMEDFANQSRKLIGLANKAFNLNVSCIKGLFEGFKQFCIDADLDSENILKTIPIKDCCHDIDLLLSNKIEMDMQYVAFIKGYFSEHWHF